MMDSITDTCCLCRRERESIDHLFIHCSVTSSIWGHFLNLCGVAWCFLGSLSGLVKAWRGSPMVGCSVILWRLIPYSIIWSIYVK